jgi:hypothetical protein
VVKRVALVNEGNERDDIKFDLNPVLDCAREVCDCLEVDCLVVDVESNVLSRNDLEVLLL